MLRSIEYKTHHILKNKEQGLRDNAVVQNEVK
jgi:hypothetical protein